MKPEIILLDIDGVIVDFKDTYLMLLKELHGVHKTEADITNFDFTKCIATVEQDRAIWRHIERSPGMVYNFAVYDGAMDFLAELRQLGRVVACTSPANANWTAERSQWLQDKAGFSKRDIVLASDKSLIGGDYLIDDLVKNLAEWSEEGGCGGYPLLFDRPWNQIERMAGAPCPYWARCHDYKHVLTEIIGLQLDTCLDD